MDCRCRNEVENHHLLVEISAYSSNQPPVAVSGWSGQVGEDLEIILVKLAANFCQQVAWWCAVVLYLHLHQTILMFNIKPGVH